MKKPHPAMRPFALTALLAGCAGQQLTPAQLAARERCYQAAEAQAQQRVDRECPGSFTSCAAADAILEELRRAQEECP